VSRCGADSPRSVVRPVHGQLAVFACVICMVRHTSGTSRRSSVAKSGPAELTGACGRRSRVRHLLLVALFAVGVAGCSGGHSASPTPTGRLQIAVRLWPRTCPFGALSRGCAGATATVRHYTLTCDPAGGSDPNPTAACRALGDYVKRRHHAGGCIGVLARPGSTAVIAGTYAHRPFRLKLGSGYSWCGQPPALLRDFWVLSTFPCSTLVLREGGSSPRWPTATGCLIDAP